MPMSKETIARLNTKITLTPQERRDRRLARLREYKKKLLTLTPSAPIPDAKARIAEAIKQAEQTQRNIDSLDQGK